MKILNLGAGGFIGSHLTHRLLAEGHAVTAVDLWSDKVTEMLDHPRLTFIRQDIRDPACNLDQLVTDADLVIGVPAVFVSAAESKEAALRLPTPYIVACGRKGGSTIAVAIIHALLLLSTEAPA